MKVMLNNEMVDFDACVNLMDDEIREELAAEGIEDEQDFLNAYIERHYDKFDGEEFSI